MDSPVTEIETLPRARNRRGNNRKIGSCGVLRVALGDRLEAGKCGFVPNREGGRFGKCAEVENVESLGNRIFVSAGFFKRYATESAQVGARPQEENHVPVHGSVRIKKRREGVIGGRSGNRHVVIVTVCVVGIGNEGIFVLRAVKMGRKRQSEVEPQPGVRGVFVVIPRAPNAGSERL